MPRLHTASYDNAKALFIKGMDLQSISERLSIKYGALRKYAERHKWTPLRQQTQETVSRVVAETCATTAKGHVSTVMELLGSHLKALKRRDPEDLAMEDFDTATKILDRLDQIGRRAHGLDADQSVTRAPGLVQIVVNNGNIAPIRVRELGPDETIQNAIEVETVTASQAEQGQIGPSVEGQ